MDVIVRDSLREATERDSQGRCTVVRDCLGNPNWMLVLRKFRMESVFPELGCGVHPAFIINGREVPEILVGMHMASRRGSLAASVPNALPWTRASLSEADATCRRCGKGFCLTSNAVYAANALLLLKEFGSRHYAGNTDYGRDWKCHWMLGELHSKRHYAGDRRLNGKENHWEGGLTLTGSGGIDWTDRLSEWGLSDLVGNAWEWCSGFRLVNGELQIFPNNDAMAPDADLSSRSKAWRCILESGELAPAESRGSLKYDAFSSGDGENACTGQAFLSDEISCRIQPRGYASSPFQSLRARDGLNVPAIAYALGLMPLDRQGIQGSYWTRNCGEMAPVRGGGDWSDGSGAGPFAFFAYHSRYAEDFKFSFRLSYVP